MNEALELFYREHKTKWARIALLMNERLPGNRYIDDSVRTRASSSLCGGVKGPWSLEVILLLSYCLTTLTRMPVHLLHLSFVGRRNPQGPYGADHQSDIKGAYRGVRQARQIHKKKSGERWSRMKKTRRSPPPPRHPPPPPPPPPPPLLEICESPWLSAS